MGMRGDSRGEVAGEVGNHEILETVEFENLVKAVKFFFRYAAASIFYGREEAGAHLQEVCQCALAHPGAFAKSDKIDSAHFRGGLIMSW